MPQRYSRQPPQFLRSQSIETIQPMDADDSIVLSDLVRSGEASRLRRRGAIRLDHGLLSTQQNEGGRRSPPAVIIIRSPIVRSPTWVPVDPPSDGESQAWDQSYESSSRVPPRRAAAEPDTYIYTLFCGGEESSTDFTGHVPPFSPSPLPSYPPLSPRPHSHKRFSTKRLNGCGAVVHTRASSRQHQSVWVAKAEATGAVIPMDASYFERSAVVKIMRSACGCVREGVGCAICGNTLGTRYKPCQAAAEGLMTPQNQPSGPLRPEGPSYWHTCNSSPSNTHSHIPFIYTFFGSHVTSSVSARSAPKNRSLSPTSQQQVSSEPNMEDSFNYSFFDRVITASPAPLSEDDGMDMLIPAPLPLPPPSPAFDPDGAYIATEPSSPDKTGSELMLAPER
ncbi:hypothetical protein SERLA73DRAFT_187230 [Serpula lacrymans var. lacrymans S7.3]|uniref:Uncharacterized protein n=2 Tax=Serpula lacrymans var. lacrymans TaxID=341189 RepID=F8Q8Q3_SERL3|nr:uncharacterized protein SERLADRAFT_476652 [Serpula lacrymans var. lacrymans S7.9]EGN94958.1 hypothetical protein SERLA73DRAFT_187230 [Serpula lacrymans var. lacrymans S7.3]EGO20448.1 hypothetical protein SERLADRAFT_476652 [Serpula lacrymans var. lacrymans S7.9]